MSARAFLPPLLLIAFASGWLPQTATAFSVAYDQEVTSQGQTMASKVLIKDSNFRIETVEQGMRAVVIKNSRGIFQYLPDQGLVVPMPAVGPNQQMIEHPDNYLAFLKQRNATWMRSEAADGYDCDVYVYGDPQSHSEVTAWVAKKLQFPVRVEMNGREGRMRVNLKNIVLGAGIEDKVFELPAGAQSMSLDKLMQGVSDSLERR